MVLFLADEHCHQPKPELNHTFIVPDNSFHDVTAFFLLGHPTYNFERISFILKQYIQLYRKRKATFVILP